MEPVALDFLGKGFSCVVMEYATEGRDFTLKNFDPTKRGRLGFSQPFDRPCQNNRSLTSKCH